MPGHVTASRGKNPEMDKPSDTKHQRRPMKEPAEPHTASPSSLILPNPHLSDQTSRRNPLGLSPKALRNGGDVPRSHGYSNTRRVREASNDFLPSSRSIWDSQEKVSKSNNYSPAQSRIMDKNTVDTQKKGVRGVRSAPKSAGTSKPAQNNLVQFEVNMADFPELAGYPLGKAASLVPRTSASAWKSGRRESPTQRDLQQRSTDVKPDSPAVSPGQPVVTSWANVASQPPKKPVPHEKLTSNNHMQVEEMAARQEDGDPAKKKRKKKKKKGKGAGGDAEAESEEPVVYQEPPKFEDEEEFPGLTPAVSRVDRLISSSSAAKPCCEENQRAGGQHPSANENKDKSAAAKKAQKTEKASGKKSKVPVQLDIGNMLAVLEKKQQTQKAKLDAKPLVLSVGGGLPVVQKQPSVQKKPPWQQEKIAHNPLDSTSPMVKKGKQREVPKAKKPTPLKKVILKEREERKQRRLLEERGLLPDNEATPEEQDQPEAAEEEEEKEEEEQCDTNITEEVVSPTEEPDVQKELTDTNQTVMDSDEEGDKEDVDKQQTTSPVSCPVSRPKIHSRKFRDYCTQMLSRDVDECVTKLLKELVRFQDRLYQKDPMKARMKRRIVMGLREVLKHLKLRKVKCVIISPNCERIQSKGGLDEALHNIIETCREQGVPFVFALSRKDLGHCVNKAVPVSLVGIFNYDGAQDYYHQMIELSTEARRAYDEMVSSLEESSQAEAQQAEEEQQISLPAVEAESGPDATYPEEAEYIRIWKTMLEKENNHVFLNFEKQLSSLCLDSEGTENTEDAKS